MMRELSPRSASALCNDKKPCHRLLGLRPDLMGCIGTLQPATIASRVQCYWAVKKAGHSTKPRAGRSAAKTCPHFLWAKLWITLFTSPASRAAIGLPGGAQKLHSLGDWCRRPFIRRTFGNGASDATDFHGFSSENHSLRLPTGHEQLSILKIALPFSPGAYGRAIYCAVRSA